MALIKGMVDVRHREGRISSRGQAFIGLAGVQFVAEAAVLELASYGGHDAVVEFLLGEAGCVARAACAKAKGVFWGLSALHACRTGADKVLAVLLDRGMLLGERVIESANAEAAGRGHLSCVRVLLDRGLGHPTAAFAAAASGHADVLRLLVRCG